MIFSSYEISPFPHMITMLFNEGILLFVLHANLTPFYELISKNIIFKD